VRRSHARVVALLLSACTAALIGQQCAPITSTPNTDPPTPQQYPRVTIKTDKGDIVIELFTDQAPASVAAFLRYINESFYKDLIFHSAVKGKSIIAGAYTRDLKARATHDPVPNESSNGLRNYAGRVALYTPNGPDSGTSQFLINLAENAASDYNPATGTPGLSVFGRVVRGMDVATAIGNLATRTATAGDGTALPNLPGTPPVIIGLLDVNGNAPPPITPTLGDNHAPIASAGTDSITVPGLTATLDGTGSNDPDVGDQLTYAWTQLAGKTVTLSNPAAAKPTFVVPDGADIYTFRLTATDLLGASASAPVTLTSIADPRVRIKTTRGEILVDVLLADAPRTSLNFLQYVADGFYTGTYITQVIAGKAVQGGGFVPTADTPLAQTGARAPIANEYSPTRKNVRGTLAMAKRANDPDSAVSQFFFTLADTPDLDTLNGGYSVFARVVRGMEVVDAIGAIETTNLTTGAGQQFNNLPIDDVVFDSVTIESSGVPSNYTTTASGLMWRDLIIGTGPRVLPTSTIQVLYVGRITDQNGAMFDSAEDPSNPQGFPLSNLIAGWKEGLGEVEMHEGGKRILIVPPDLGYGSSATGDIPANSTLYFELDVLKVE
jgi:peptidyl-prolyl cis-trans isomerase A (cyclophilin A)